jgi:hypothetical protein
VEQREEGEAITLATPAGDGGGEEDGDDMLPGWGRLAAALAMGMNAPAASRRARGLAAAARGRRVEASSVTMTRMG